MNKFAKAKAFIVGSGIASLSAAALLIRDGRFRGGNIRILEELAVAGGALDGSGDPVHGYVTRGGRMWTEEAYVCLWNVLDSVPTLTDPARTVKEAVWAFNEVWESDSHARLIGRGRTILDAADLGFNLHDRLELTRLLATPERVLGTKRIEDCFFAHLFATNFWAMWRTTFAFQNWHSAIELKRYMLRFLQEFPRIHTLGGVRRTALNQYDSVVRPMERWLTAQGVLFEYGVKVTDVDFVETDGERRIETIHGTRRGESLSYAVGRDDYAFVTIGSMTADSRNGNVDESKWESFTLTMRTSTLVRRIEEFTGNKPGTGAIMTFTDTSWLLSAVVPHPPRFAGQPDDVFRLWGYGLLVDNTADHVDVTVAQATGQEILTELLHHLGCEDILDEVRRSTTVIPVIMPYTTSQFEWRDGTDQPRVIPDGAKNFALLGQYVEIPEDVVFTVEYSVAQRDARRLRPARPAERDSGRLPRHRRPQGGARRVAHAHGLMAGRCHSRKARMPLVRVLHVARCRTTGMGRCTRPRPRRRQQTRRVTARHGRRPDQPQNQGRHRTMGCCSDVMEPIEASSCCTPEDTAQHAARAMRESGCGCAPVIEKGDTRTLVGVVTERDVCCDIAADDRRASAVRVEDIMRPASACCGTDESIEDARRKLQEQRATSLPVVDRAGRCCGTVSMHRLERS